MADEDNKGQKIDITLGEDIADGVYANLAIITHSHSEFIVDFVALMPGVTKGKVKSRVILTPQHAKRLLLALDENIKRYESMHGQIQDYDDPRGLPLNLGRTKGDA
ncbi:MAG: DUF3467 domain-containing protein [Bacteroidales bacterium]|nr:DUF3467 domain-containing protein [Bacteroidales bacterium]